MLFMFPLLKFLADRHAFGSFRLFIILTDSNKIKAINGGVLQKLTKLTRVWLTGNVCINENFNDYTFTSMDHILSQKCGFNETVEQITEKETQETQIQQIVTNKTISELENCQTENTKLNAELVAAKSVRDRNEVTVETMQDRFDITVNKLEDRYDNLFALVKDLGNRLEMQYNQTLAANAEKVNLKTSENESLMKEMQKKNEEVDANHLKIKSLEERVRILNGSNQW